MRYAAKTYTPAVDPNYYEKGLNYEKVTAEQKAMKLEGYQFEGEIFTDSYKFRKGDNPIAIKFKKGNGVPENCSQELLAERPATDKFNSTTRLSPGINGTFTGNLFLPETGIWNLTVTSNCNGKKFSKSIQANAGN
ncbi:MAG: FixH family protein [Leptospira sp.]|nr:FixH family protein [Leptospira sp.]